MHHLTKRKGLYGVVGAVIVLLTPVAYATVTINANVFARNTFSITGTVSKGAGTFVIDHPLDPANKLLYHSFVESPSALNEYQGTATFDENGDARIELPAYFEALNTDFTYQFMPLNQAMPDLYIKQKIADNTFVIGGGVSSGEVSWMVTGVRHDPYILAHPIVTEVEKGPKALLKKGECIYPSLCE